MTAPSSHLKNSTKMYLSLPMMTDSMVLKHEFFMSTVYHFILPIAHFNFKLYIFLEHIPSSHSHLYSILLTLLYILPLSTQLGCVCLPRIWLFCLCIYDSVSQPRVRGLIWVRGRLWLSPQAPWASKFTVMPSDNNFAVSHHIYTFEVVWSAAYA